MRWPHLPGPTPIGIDIGARFIKAAQLKRSSRGWTVQAATCLPRQSPDAPIDAAEARRLTGTLDRQGFVGRTAVVAMPPEKVMTGMLDLPPAGSGAPMDQIARMELARMQGWDPKAFELVYWMLPPSPQTKGQTQVLAAGCTHNDANAVLDVLEGAGLRVQALDTHVCALVRAYAPLLVGSAGVVGVMDIGWKGCTLVVLHQGTVIYQRKLPEAGIARLSTTLAEQLKLAPPELEALLTQVGLTAKPAEAAEAAEVAEGAEGGDPFEAARGVMASHFEQVSDEIRAPLFYAMQQYPGTSVERLLLAGGGASIPGLPERLTSMLDVGTHVVRPADLAECPHSLLDKCSTAGLTVAIGLAQFPN